jgi:hypothetical protein
MPASLGTRRVRTGPRSYPGRTCGRQAQGRIATRREWTAYDTVRSFLQISLLVNRDRKPATMLRHHDHVTDEHEQHAPLAPAYLAGECRPGVNSTSSTNWVAAMTAESGSSIDTTGIRKRPDLPNWGCSLVACGGPPRMCRASALLAGPAAAASCYRAAGMWLSAMRSTEWPYDL